MGEAKTGRCQCGAVKYQLTGEPLALGVCHCSECQRQSGSAFGMSLIVPAESFDLVQGELKTFTRKADSGATVECSFCPTCGTRIHHRPAAMAGTVNIKPGTLDDTSWLSPDIHIWTGSKQPWVPISDEVPCIEGQP